MARRSLTPKQHDILRAVCGILSDPTRRQFSLTDIAQAMQLSRAAAYRHFESKSHVSLVMLQWCRGAIHDMFADIDRRSEIALSDKAISKIRSIVLFAEQNPGVVRFLTGEALDNDPELLGVLEAFWSDVTSLLSSTFSLQQTNGKLCRPLDTAKMGAMATDYLRGACMRYSMSGFKSKPSEAIQTYSTVLFLCS